MFAQQLTLPGIEKLPKHKSRKSLGLWGEQIACQWLNRQGLKARLQPWGESGDVRIIGFEGVISKVEVKTSLRSGKYGFWQFGIKHATTDYTKADYLLLQAIVDDCGGMVRFLIPTSAIDQHQIVMRNPLSSKSKFYQYLVNGDIEL